MIKALVENTLSNLSVNEIFHGDIQKWDTVDAFLAYAALDVISKYVKDRSDKIKKVLADAAKTMGEKTDGGGYRLKFPDHDGSINWVRSVYRSVDMAKFKDLLKRKRIAKDKVIRRIVKEEIDKVALEALLKTGDLTQEDLKGIVEEEERWSFRLRKPSYMKPLLEGKVRAV